MSEKYGTDESETVKRFKYRFSDDEIDRAPVKKYDQAVIEDVSRPYDFSDITNEIVLKEEIVVNEAKFHRGIYVTLI